jgi:hypothetical protein
VSAELVREAVRDGERIALLRCFDGPEGWTIVEAELTKPDQEAPVTRGPYRFRNAAEAFRFVQEALLALQYLGCTVLTV